MSGNKIYDNARKVIAFNSLKKLSAIFSSLTSAANSLNVGASSIHYVCTGKGVSCKGLYFRYLYIDKIEIDIQEDLGKLTLAEYDKLVGLDRPYYIDKQMTKITNKKKKTKSKI